MVHRLRSFVPTGTYCSTHGPAICAELCEYSFLQRYVCITNLPSQTILVDLSPGRAASVTAALNIGRCLVGAAFVAAVQYVIDDIGNGWTFTIFGLGSLVLSAPLLELVIRRGPHWNAAREGKSPKVSKTETH